QVQLFLGPPAEPVQRGPAFGDLDPFGAALGFAPPDALAPLAGVELVVHPLPFREPLAEVADRLAVDPQRHLAVRVAAAVHLHHEFDADPATSLDLQLGVAYECVAPGLPLRGAAAHLAPVRVKVPEPVIAERLDAHAERLVAGGSLPGTALRPRRRGVVAS